MLESDKSIAEHRAAVAAVQHLFMQLVRAGRECDLLCRTANITRGLYNAVELSVKEGDTPQKLSERVKFVRQLATETAQERELWSRTVQKLSRKEPRAGAYSWYCPLCGADDCAGTMPVRFFSSEQGAHL